jgi:hypothetical protein
MTWQQLLRKAWRDVTRQIDITLRHHKRQDYDALYEQVSWLGTLSNTPENTFIDLTDVYILYRVAYILVPTSSSSEVL